MVTVTLPGGRRLDAALQARRQMPDGAWEYDITLPIPAAAVAPIPGEDYTDVPTHRPPVTEPTWVIAPVGRSGDRLEVHRGDRCWMPMTRKGRIVSREEAARAVAEGVAACDVCRADP